MSDKNTVWLRRNDGGEPIEVEATPSALIPLMIRGYVQCDPPQEVVEHVDR